MADPARAREGAGAGLRLLVCGGRDFADRAALDAALDRVRETRGVALLIHGAARGADRLAEDWARKRGVFARAFPADWERHGRRAGPIRNVRMLEEGKPDAVVAFPGGAGTAHMVKIARDAGLPVWQPMGGGDA